jgi:sugar phosphate isomerase/epimerase
VRELLQGKSREEIYDVLKQIKDIGYGSVQISAVGEIDKKLAETYRDICAELGLVICVTHTSLDKLESELDWIIEYHKMWGCTKIGIGSMPDDMRNEKGMHDFIPRLNSIGRKVAPHGQKIVYHNHKFEYEKFDGKTMMETLFDELDPECIEFEIDTYWVQAGGENPVNWIYKTNGRMSIIHFKDFRIKADEQQFAEIGQGNLNWDLIIEACKETGVEYAAIEQDSFTDDPIASLKMSYDFLKGKGLK